MKHPLLAALGAAAVAAGLAQPADAALMVRLGGLALYDTDLDITWLADANAGAGSIFDDGVSATDGLMTWANANAWAASLTVAGIGGWRLPATLVPDGACFVDFQGNTPSAMSNGYFCTGSEMGHMYYDELGGQTYPLDTIAPVPNEIVNLMFNVRQYWSGTDLPSSGTGIDRAWSFDFRIGRQEPTAKTGEFFAWAVRSGDVAAATVPEAGTLGLTGLALLGLAVAGGRRLAPRPTPRPGAPTPAAGRTRPHVPLTAALEQLR